jgi:hypothetical protein
MHSYVTERNPFDRLAEVFALELCLEPARRSSICGQSLHQAIGRGIKPSL